MTKQFGKLKLHVSKRGIAYKWGDGEIRRLAFGASGNGQGEGYAAAGDSGQGEQYGQHGYARYDSDFDPNGGQGHYGRDYDPNYDADDYGAQYDQQHYAGNQNYDAEQSGYYEDRPHESMALELLYHNDWVMYAALVLLPPLGIWILWKREKFDLVVRAAISALSAIWFIVLLIWLFSAMFKSPDPTTPTMNQGIPTPTQTASTLPAATGGAGIDITATLPPTNPSGVGNLPVNINGGGTTADTSGNTGTGTETSNQVWVTATSAYYHKTNTCTKITGTPTQVDMTVARQQNKQPCTTCYNDTTTAPGATKKPTSGGNYFATSTGKYYHVSATCSGMRNASRITKKQAEARGQKSCPVCIGKRYYMTTNGKYYHSISSCSKMKNAKTVTLAQAKNAKKKPCPVCLKKTSSGVSYYASAGGTYYHAKATCSGMKNAKKITSAVASQRKLKPCPVCLGTSSQGGNYYATSAGKYYHTKSNCSGMKGAAKITLTKAKSRGLKACPVCVNKATTATYYATASGSYYHVKSDCSGMKGAKKITLATAKKNNKKACPVCIGSAPTNTYVYTTTSGKYYHSKNNCSGMKSAQRVTLANAKAKGKKACPVCMSTVFYYTTSSSSYYHKSSTCSGMKGATKITLVSARSKGKSACPICVTKKANKNDYKTYCYATTGGIYYHKNKTCQGMKNAKKVTLAYAKGIGKKACPVCVVKAGKQSTTQAADAKVKCFLLKKGTFYHSTKNCAKLKGKKGIVTTSVATAKKNKKTACPDCVGTRLKTYVYATPTGLLYHKNAHCGGMKNAMKLTLQTALNRAYKRCTKCNAPSA